MRRRMDPSRELDEECIGSGGGERQSLQIHPTAPHLQQDLVKLNSLALPPFSHTPLFQACRTLLQDDTASTASLVVVITTILVLALAARAAVRRRALVHRRAAGLLLIVTSDLAHQVIERLVDIDPALCGRLDELAVEVRRHITTLYFIIVSELFNQPPHS